MVMRLFRFIFLGYLFSIANLLSPMQSLIQRKLTTSKGLQHVESAQTSLADSKRKQEGEGAKSNPIADCSNPVLHAQERPIYAAVLTRLRADDIRIPHELGHVVLSYLPLLMEWNRVDIRQPTTDSISDFHHWIWRLTQVNDHEVVFGDGSAINVYDIERGTPHLLKKHATKIMSMVMLPRGDLVSIERFNGIVVQWDMQTKKVRRSLGNENDTGTQSIALLPDGDVITGDSQGFARIWDMHAANDEKSKAEKKNKKIFDGPYMNTVSSIVVLGHRVAMGDVNKSYIMLWSLDDDTLHRPLEEHPGGVSSLVGLPNNDLASGDSEGNIYIWDVALRTVKKRFKQSAWITHLLALSDGNLVASSNDGVIILWDIAKKAKKWNAQEHSAYADKLAITGDGDLVSGSMAAVDDEIIIWDREKGTLKCRLYPSATSKTGITLTSMLVMKDGTIVGGFSNGALKKWHQTPCQACRKAAVSTSSAQPSSK